MNYIKIIGAALVTVSLTTGTAIACDKKMDKTKVEKTTTTQSSMVIPASADQATEKVKVKTYSFDEAMTLCQKYGAEDFHAKIKLV